MSSNHTINSTENNDTKMDVVIKNVLFTISAYLLTINIFMKMVNENQH